MNGVKGIRREKLREQQYMEGYIRCHKGERVKWNEGRNVEQMWEQVK